MARYFQFILTVIVSFTVLPSSWAHIEVEDFEVCEAQLEKLTTVLNDNLFTTGREFKHYNAAFGSGQWLKSFLTTIRNKKFHWIDAGAGMAFPQQQALKISQIDSQILTKKQRQLLSATAIGYTHPLGDENFVPKHPRFRYLTGDLLTEIPAAQLGRTDLITDLFGPFSYTTDVSALMDLYLKILKVGGELLLVMDVSKTKIINSGEESELSSVLCSMLSNEYFSCERKDSKVNGFFVYSYRIKKLKKSDTYQFPRLKLVQLTSGAPPRRIFIRAAAGIGAE